LLDLRLGNTEGISFLNWKEEEEEEDEEEEAT